MKSRGFSAVALVLLTLTACAPSVDPPSGTAAVEAEGRATAGPAPSPSPSTSRAANAVSTDSVGSFSKQRAMGHLRKLAGDIGVRLRTTRDETRAARYVAEKLRSFGYNVNIQTFEVDDGTSRNVVAWWPGSRPHGFVIGSHMDSVAGSPGANDNASGVAVTLELARLAAGKPPSEWVRFVAFGSEEAGSDGNNHAGSEVFVNRLGERGRARLGGMASVDMIAAGRPLLVGNSGIADDVVARSLFRRVRDAGIAVRFHTLCDCSDHGPFERAGIPASFAYSGPEENNHEASDSVTNIEPDDVLRTGRAMRAFLLAIDRDMIERFRRQ